MINVTPSGEACGAVVTGLDLSQPQSTDTIQEIRDAWLEHHVLAFPNQQLTDEDLVRVTDYFGSVGDDPYFVPINKKTPVVALTRRADEQAPVFAENWHTDWSFKKHPPLAPVSTASSYHPLAGTPVLPINRWHWHRCPTNCDSDLRTRLRCIPQPLPMGPKEPTVRKTKAMIAA